AKRAWEACPDTRWQAGRLPHFSSHKYLVSQGFVSTEAVCQPPSSLAAYLAGCPHRGGASKTAGAPPYLRWAACSSSARTSSLAGITRLRGWPPLGRSNTSPWRSPYFNSASGVLDVESALRPARTTIENRLLTGFSPATITALPGCAKLS